MERLTVATYTWTRFNDATASNKREITHEWRELYETLQNAGPYPSKSFCPWIKLARFGTQRTVKNSLRSNSNLIEIVGVEGDYDGEKVQPETAIALLEKANLRAIVYTSPSHTPDKPRWRVLAPLSQPLSPSERTQMLARVNGALGGLLTPESFTLSQSYYYGRVAGQADYRVLATFDDVEDGICVDDAHELDTLAVVATGLPQSDQDDDDGIPAAHAIAEAVKTLGRTLKTGDNRRILLRKYIGDRSNRGMSPDEIHALVDCVTKQYFDPADPVDWANVNEMIDDICSSDQRERDQIDKTVGEFIKSIESPVARGFVSAADFAAAASSPDYVVDGIVRRGYLYALTGMSNAGKTSIGLRMVKCIDNGLAFGAHGCIQGRCLILAGENPDDVAYRFLAEAQHDISSVAATFSHTTVLPFSFAIDQGLPFIQEQAKKDGGYAFVLVDSKTAYFGGDSEDDNAQAYRQARFLRELTGVRGRPGVMVISHPIKRPDAPDQLLPRGGSAFLNEIDGNLTAWRESGAETVRLAYTKIRGTPFDPVDIRISVVELQGIKTSSGKPVTSVLALPTNHDDVEHAQAKEASNEDLLLGVINDNPKDTQRGWAQKCGWTDDKGTPRTGKVSKVLEQLRKDKLIWRPRQSKPWQITKKGKDEVDRLRGNASAEALLGDEK